MPGAAVKRKAVVRAEAACAHWRHVALHANCMQIAGLLVAGGRHCTVKDFGLSPVQRLVAPINKKIN